MLTAIFATFPTVWDITCLISTLVHGVRYTRPDNITLEKTENKAAAAPVRPK